MVSQQFRNFLPNLFIGTAYRFTSVSDLLEHFASLNCDINQNSYLLWMYIYNKDFKDHKEHIRFRVTGMLQNPDPCDTKHRGRRLSWL